MALTRPLIRQRMQRSDSGIEPIIISDVEKVGELNYCWEQCTEIFSRHKIPFKNLKRITLRDGRTLPVKFGQQVVSYNVNGRFVRMSLNTNFFAIVFTRTAHTYVISHRKEWDEDIEQRLKTSFTDVPTYARANYATNEPTIYLTYQAFMHDLVTYIERYIEKDSVNECVIL